ncbi:MULTISPECIES: C39 family peptidase [Halomonadaceae]|uniref:C39 family peptidase n=1 Tax=Halomonadaceae TaxID=28256 RepID=UPI001581EC77|nr:MULTISPECIES: C39 family peptidase [Halomonas]MDI4636405.1 C39 family peptidase [Halomonas sp. BMC7]NUJ60769.1 C39 family peptidase [Halomonas taeanensis]
MSMFFRSAAIAAFLSLATQPAWAGPVTIVSPFGSFNVKAESLNELRWESVVRQQYDFSCGSAAVATLLTYHYERPTSEAEVFESMINRGDADKIRTYGFSMLDMKQYLDSQGLNSDGFRVKLEDFIGIGLPAITLINTGGYKHFVVIKGMDDGNVLVGDPAVGTVVVPKEHFETLWTGTVLGAREDMLLAKQYFNNDRDWQVRPNSPLQRGMQRSAIGSAMLPLPGRNELGR